MPNNRDRLWSSSKFDLPRGKNGITESAHCLVKKNGVRLFNTTLLSYDL
jgi:hypothetical protein